MTVPTYPSFAAAEQPEVDLRELVDHLPDPLLCLDRAWIVTYANRAAVAMLHPPHGSGAGIVGRHVLDLWNGAVVDDLEPHLVRAGGEGPATGFVTRERRSGRTIEVRVRPHGAGLAVSCHPALVAQPDSNHGGDGVRSQHPGGASDGATVLGVGIVTLDVTELKKAQQSLVQSRRNLTLAVEASGLGYAHLDLGTQEVTLSERCRQIFGTAPEETYTFDDFKARLHPDDRERVLGAICRAIAEHKVHRDEYRLVRSNGSMRWVEVSAQPEYDERDGRPVRLGGFVRDVTDRKMADEVAERSRQLFQHMAEASPGLLYVYDLRPERNTYVNRSVTDVLGYSVEAIGALDVPTFEQMLHPDDVAEAAAARARFAGLGDGQVDTCTYRVRHADGSWRWLRNRCVVFSRDPATGAPVEVLGVCQDVTDLKTIEQTLRENEARLRASQGLLEMAQKAAQVGVWSMGLGDRAGEWSDQCHALYGTDARSFVPRYEAWLALVHEADRIRVDRAVRRTLQYRADLSIEFRVRHPVRGTRWLSMSGRLLDDGPGGPDRIAGIALDVTDRKTHEVLLQAARDEAEAASRAKDNFLAALSHELRTPLTPVVMTLAAMEMNPDLPSQAREDVQTIRRNIELETRLIDDLLDVTRVAHNKLKLQPRPAHAHELIGVVVGICKADADARGLRVERDLAAANDLIVADPPRFQQVLWNLLKNAIKFTPEGGTITIRTRNEEQWTADSGLPMRVHRLLCPRSTAHRPLLS